MDIDRAMQYLDFVTERHRIWEQRQAGTPGPWTADPVLAGRKFTNVFRVLDPGSQFVLTDLLPDCDPRDFLARCLLYRLTNRPETWRALQDLWGQYPTADQLGSDLADELCRMRDNVRGFQVFSGAYMIMPRPGLSGADKTREVVLLAREVIDRSWHTFQHARTPAQKYAALRSNPGIGDFLAQQVLTDFGYGFPTDPDETFVVAGPGARLGASYLLGNRAQRTAQQAIAWAAVTGPTMPGWPSITTPSGQRVPSSMDLQNTFCEFSKYVRFEGRPTAAYRPAHPGAQPAPVLPAHW